MQNIKGFGDVAQILFSGLGQHHTTLCAQKQSTAKLLLQLADLLADRRRGQGQLGSRFCQAAQFGRDFEGVYHADFWQPGDSGQH